MPLQPALSKDECLKELEKAGVLDDWHVYGSSRKPVSTDPSRPSHSKRAIAADLMAWVDAQVPGAKKLVVVGHDRGGRVAYRLAKDFRDRVSGLCLLDIVPTKMMFERMSYKAYRHASTLKAYHWFFLAQPSPLPETLIHSNSSYFITTTINSSTGSRWRGKLNSTAMSSWVDQYRDWDVIVGACEDYRAAVGVDLDHDEEDEKEGKMGVDCPLLVLSSVKFGKAFDVKGVWEGLGTKDVKQVVVADEETGHYLPVEAGEEVSKALVEWLSQI
ncbi:hypothetical protein MNV49_001701 [Pseudohyphozyma bogoriensis]|nr:hypothetical protein MNV49_001701 [Pseudohyphozyma bogoriensis]